MAGVKIELPASFSFSCDIPIRITDVNYGGHVGNDAILSIIHEARMQFFKRYGYSEMNFDGAGLIMVDVAIEFKKELFYGDTIFALVKADRFSRAGFDIFYKLETHHGDKDVLVAVARTGMICYDYNKKKIIAVPEKAKEKLSV